MRPVLGNERVQVPGGSKKKPQSKSGRKQQVSGSRPRDVHQHTVCREGSEDRNLESVVVRDLMAETLSSWLLDPLLSSFFFLSK